MDLNSLLSGAIVMAALTIALFFLRFWRATGDNFFRLFALAFSLMALERLLAWQFRLTSEDVPQLYLIRLLSYGLILFAIVRKNRRSK
ncbi:MAG TPA: DUF5985 family protein [Pseudoduganella sp.]|jgi:hypothetical protein